MYDSSHAQKINQQDEFRKSFDHASTRLTIKALPLSQPHATSVHLLQFTDAAFELARICANGFSKHTPLEVLMWLHTRLLNEVCNENRSDVFVAHCRREIERVEDAISMLCPQARDIRLAALH